MKIALFTKEGKPTVPEVIAFLKEQTDDLVVFEGKLGDPFPKEAKTVGYDLLISYISPWIISQAVLDNTRLWNINFHPGPPNYPGIGCFNFAIYDNETEYGVTAHLMEAKVDTGKIVGVKRFSLLPSDSVYTLSVKSYDNMLSLFERVIGHIVTNKALPECDEIWQRKPYTRKELEALCVLDMTMSKEEMERRIRAVAYPNMPGAYLQVHNYKFEYNPSR